jgi:hypothetical protein
MDGYIEIWLKVAFTGFAAVCVSSTLCFLGNLSSFVAKWGDVGRCGVVARLVLFSRCF